MNCFTEIFQSLEELPHYIKDTSGVATYELRKENFTINEDQYHGHSLFQLNVIVVS